jgi:hypothetical protein
MNCFLSHFGDQNFSSPNRRNALALLLESKGELPFPAPLCSFAAHRAATKLFPSRKKDRENFAAPAL